MIQKKRLRRTMMFLNSQRAGLLKDAYVYGADSIIFDLEDAVAENQKDSARIALYYTLKEADYKGTERIVRINGRESRWWREDIRAAVAGGADGIRIPKCEYKEDVEIVEAEVEKAEQEFGRTAGETLLMAAIETPMGVFNALELARSSKRMLGISIGAGDFLRTMHATARMDGAEMFQARAQIVMAARAADIMCFDTVHINVDDISGLERDTALIRDMGFDGKSVINPKQISVIHKVFTPDKKQVEIAERTILEINRQAEAGTGVFLINGAMVDIAMLEGAKRVIELAKASGVYKGVL